MSITRKSRQIKSFDDIEGYALSRLFRTARKCSLCRQPGHNSRNCVSSSQLSPPTRNDETLLDFQSATLSQIPELSFKLPPVRGFPKDAKPHFLKLCCILMRIIHDNCIVNANSEYLLNNAIQAFLFLPSIILNSELKQHKSNTLIKKLQEAIQNRDPIGFVLNQRAACISKAYSSPQRRKQKESTPPISAPLPKTLRHKVENLTKKGNLAKALKVIT